MDKRMVLLWILLAAPLGAAGQTVTISVGGGVGFPSMPAEFPQYWFTGPSATVGIEYRLTRVFALAGRFDYGTFRLNGDRILADLDAIGLGVQLSGGTVSMIAGTGNLKAYPFPGMRDVRPYLIAGAGMVSLNLTRIDVTGPGGSESVDGTAETALAIAFGAGVAFPLTGTVDLFLEGRYTVFRTEDENTNVLPLVAGVRINF